MTNNRPTFITILTLMLLSGLAHDAFAADKYLVNTRIFHLGELIAEPVVEVEANKTAGGSFTTQGGRQYSFAVLLRPMAGDRAYVSMQFSSGTLSIQPNLLVDIGKEKSATIKKARLSLLVHDVEDADRRGLLALNH